ncbi:MAG: Uma2 family endonuclease [Saprospiraceae bacterium]|nr:Uma2 family endonuclease [Saprospiraceae bacterium]
MTETAVAIEKEQPVVVIPKRRVLLMTVAEFIAKYARREDGFKYEFVNGKIEKTPRMIAADQLYIVDNLQRFFAKTTAYEWGDSLMSEPQAMTSPTKVRAPDVAYLTKKQMRDLRAGELLLPTFAVEIVSKNDKFKEMREKVVEYFKAGVKVVWWIVPESEEVHVFTSPTEVKICRGETLCSAEIVIEGFTLSANAIFNK